VRGGGDGRGRIDGRRLLRPRPARRQDERERQQCTSIPHGRPIFRRGGSAVNAALALAVLLGGCGYHLGQPPVAAGGFAVAPVRAPVAEPAVADALRSGLVDALAVRSALGHVHTVETRIVSLTESPVAVDEVGRVHRVALTVELRVAESGRQTVLHGERAYTVAPDDPIGGASARAAAAASLARELAHDGVEWLLRAPQAKSSP
jgi:hypothetical protein